MCAPVSAVEKEPHVVCVYGTDENHNILCAIPLCHPKYLKGIEYVVEFEENERAKVCVGELQIVIVLPRKSAQIINLSHATAPMLGGMSESNGTKLKTNRFQFIEANRIHKGLTENNRQPSIIALR